MRIQKLILFLSVFFVSLKIYAFPETGKNLPGKTISFEGRNNLKERKEIYEYFKKKEGSGEDFELSEKEIWVEACDIDGDGEDESLVIVTGRGYARFPYWAFYIFKKSSEKGITEYRPLPFGPNQRDSLLAKDVKILDNKNSGARDILINHFFLWKWNGKYYDGVFPEDLPGRYMVFDYETDSEERKEIYEYFKKKEEGKEEIFHPLAEWDIAIDSYDIDGDGEKEFLVYISNGDYCGAYNCPFYILKKFKTNDRIEYMPFQFVSESSNSIKSKDIIKILDSATLGMHDIIFGDISVWRWNGKYYDITTRLK